MKMYFHAQQVVLTENTNFRVVVVFVLHHVGHPLQLLLSALMLLWPDAYISGRVPNSASSISGFFATYLLLSDLLLCEACEFYIPQQLHPLKV